MRRNILAISHQGHGQSTVAHTMESKTYHLVAGHKRLMPPFKRLRRHPLATRAHPDEDPNGDGVGQATWVDGHKEYEVERIEAHRVNSKGRFRFLIKWKGWSARYNSWEPVRHLKNSEDYLRQYVAQNVSWHMWSNVGISMP